MCQSIIAVSAGETAPGAGFAAPKMIASGDNLWHNREHPFEHATGQVQP
jgi:hypothetical protein